MKRVGLRRVFPRISYMLRWWLVQRARGERALARMTPKERAKCLGAMDMFTRSTFQW